MDRTVDLSGDRFGYLLYAVQVAGLVLVLLFVVGPLDGSTGLPLGILFALLVVATAVGWWRRRTDADGGSHLGTAADVTYDPFADPGQAARDRWTKAVRRLPGRDDERD